MIYAGVADSTCTPSNTTYCLDIAGSRCRYTLLPINTVCNATSGTTCSGAAAQCPDSGGKQPSQAVCSRAAREACVVPGLCAATDGCRCRSGRSAPGGAPDSPATTSSCICSAQRGFALIVTDNNVARCRWALSFRGARLLSVPLSGRIALPLQLDGNVCPPQGTAVVARVESRGKVPCPSSRTPLRLEPTTTPLGETCGSYVMNVDAAGAAAGSCARIEVITTDRRSYNLTFKYR